MTMHISPDGLGFIKCLEWLSLRPYLCAAGVLRIGYGSRHYGDGCLVREDDPKINVAEAEALLCEIVPIYEQVVLDVCTVPLSGAMFDILVAFAYSVGVEKFTSSEWVRKTNAGDVTGAGEEFLKWMDTKGKGQPWTEVPRRRVPIGDGPDARRPRRVNLARLKVRHLNHC